MDHPRAKTAAVVLAAAAVGYASYRWLKTRRTTPTKVPPALPPTLTCSAPGKVLVVGGYLVLKRPLGGLVLASTSKFHCKAAWKPGGSGRATIVDVVVESPQFNKDFLFTLATTAPRRPEPVAPDSKNGFVQRAIEVALLAADAELGSEAVTRKLEELAAAGLQLVLTLLADNDFYSQTTHLEALGLPISAASLAKLPKHLPCPLDDDGKPVLNKTGMGSSAALVTSVTAAVMGAVGANPKDKDRVHSAAQVAHCLAQGKVGSGFDVCSAVFGSMRYVRVSEQTMKAHTTRVDEGLAAPSPSNVAYTRAMDVLTTASAWDHQADPFGLPRGLTLVMADIRGGSETPSMVRKILAWVSASKSDAQPAWEALTASNASVEELFKTLAGLESSPDYDAHLEACGVVCGDKWGDLGTPVGDCLRDLRAAFVDCRRLLKFMGDAAGVPVEPPQQTEAANRTSALPGVVCCGVPGAGGFDALFAIVVGRRSSPACARVEAEWTSWEASSLCPLLLEAGPSRGAPGSGLEVAMR